MPHQGLSDRIKNVIRVELEAGFTPPMPLQKPTASVSRSFESIVEIYMKMDLCYYHLQHLWDHPRAFVSLY